MIPVNGKILVRVNLKQKDTMTVAGVVLSTATKFNINYRERSPVIAEVVEGNKYLKAGDIIVCHHNHFYAPSPYHLEDDLYSIPFNKTIFARVNKKGNLIAICGNVLGERISIKTPLPIPIEYQEKYIDRILVKDKGWSSYKNGTVIICKPNAPYDIVYNFGGIEKTVTKVSEDMICGFLN